MVTKIDMNQWKKFRVGDYFDAKRGQAKIQRNLNSGKMPLIAAKAYNQGIAGYYDLPAEYSNTITISANGAGCGSAHYHEGDFAITGDALVLIPKDKLTKFELLFLTSLFSSWFSTHYGYNNKLSAKKVLDTMLSFPATAAGIPDWKYMNAYMGNVFTQAKAGLKKLSHIDYGQRKIDISDWKEFRIGELFEIKKGKRLTKAKMKPGKTRFIGSSAMNNGCTALIGNTDNINPAGLITVCYNGSVGSTFYQNEPFIASDDVNILIPKFKMNKSIAFFIMPLIKAASYRYDYIDKWTKEIMENDTIKLPVTNQGEPDFIYMENYTKNIFNHTERFFNNLKS